MATNLGSVAPTVPATASLVGNTFVNKYYNVLHQSPQVVYRFYTDRSILSRVDAGASGAVDIVIGQAGINQKIMSLDYRDFRAEIRTVDSLESLNGSVIVMVTGSLSSHGRPKRNFVQTFFLAPQEVGYFVLNDMFRYLDGDQQPLGPVEIGTPDQQIPSPQPVNLQPSPKQETREFTVFPPKEVPSVHQHYQVQEEPPVPEAPEAPEAAEVVECSQDMSPTHVADELAPPEEDASPSIEEANAEDAPKKSYASILSASKSTPISGLKYVPTKAVRHNTPSQQATQPANTPATSYEALDAAASVSEPEDETLEPEGDGCSVYVKNLPLNITATELEEEFKKFGSIKPGGVNLRNQRMGVCFAFIEYEESSSVHSAIEASPISIGGRQVYIEEKNPMPLAQRALRGRFSQGRVYEGIRSRGYLSGRGLARGGGKDFEREGVRGGRGTYGGGGNAYSSNFNTVNGYRRTDGQGWNGPRPVRQGVGTQAVRGQGSTQG